MAEPETELPLDEDIGFKAAETWFLVNEVGREQRELALAQRMARLLRIRPEVLRGRMSYFQLNLEALEEKAAAEGWSDEMGALERRREIRLAIEQLRQDPAVERAISASRLGRELPTQIIALLPTALSKVRSDHPNARPQKRLVVHEIRRLLKVNHGRCVSERRIAQALPADFACRD